MVANPITVALRELGLVGAQSETTFVPESYRFNSAAVRLSVLQGLLDSDGGSVTQRGSTCRIRYSTCSPRLRDDVVFLVRSLGGTAHCRARPTLGREPGTAAGRPTKRPMTHQYDAHVLDIRLPDGLEPFRLDRKRVVYGERAVYGEPRAERPTRFIDAIEPAGDAETVCIQVAAADSLYVTDDLIVTHNTLNDAFIILDEAQNTTPEQMKMFLTRLGFGSKIVVTGDITQVDLPGGTRSGLRVVQEILEGIEDVHFARLSSADVVRHRLVSEIVDAYEKWDAAQEAPGPHPLPGNRTTPGRAARRR
jgi:phosphate starvation-inducible PhoH-like protein